MKVNTRHKKALTEQFLADYKHAEVCEKEVAAVLVKQGLSEVEFNNDNRFDIKGKFNGETVYIEVKQDFTCQRTGNVGLEFSCRGKDSGINASKADIYAYKLHLPDGRTVLDLIKTKDLKELIEAKKFFRIVNGGDPGSNSLNYLFKLDEFQRHSVRIHTF